MPVNTITIQPGQTSSYDIDLRNLGTNTSNSDSDGDGIDDGQEVSDLYCIIVANNGITLTTQTALNFYSQ